MADRIKNYEINYNILSNAVEAAKGFGELLGYVEKLSGKDPSTNMARGLTKLNGELNQTANAVNRLKTAFSEIRPAIDLSGFKTQLGQMQRAVSEFAQQTRNIMRTALSGTDKQFAKARGTMSGDIFDVASLKHFETELKKIPQRIAEAQRAVDAAQARYDEISKTKVTYPKGSTSEDQKRISAAHNAEKNGWEKELNRRKRELKNIKEQEKDYRSQIYNLRQSLSPDAMRPMPGTVHIPKGMQKAVDLIPRWEREHEERRAIALAKRKQLKNIVPEPTNRVPKPSFYDLKSVHGKGVAIMDEYNKAYEKYISTQGIAYKEQMAMAKHKFLSSFSGYDDAQFEEAHKQFKAYEKYKADYANWVRAGSPKAQAYDQTDEYKKYRRSIRKLRAAYGAQRKLEALKVQVAAQEATSKAMANGPLPPILGMPTQVIEQAFTGKLTLLPDIPAAKALIAAEQFSANLRLLPMISDLKTKLNAETFRVNVTPSIVKSKGGKTSSAASGAFATLQEEINTLQRSAKAPITVGTQLNREGLLGRAQSGYNTLQTLANRHPITYRLASDGSGGFSLNQALTRLTQIAKTRPVPFRMVHDGSGAFSLNQALARLQALAAQRPVAISVITNASNIEAALRSAMAAKSGTAKSFPIELKPRVGELTKSIKAALGSTAGKSRSFFVDIKARTGGLVNSIRAALKGKSFNIDAKLNTTNLATQVPLLERLQRVWAELPRTGKRTYTVNLKTTGLENIARIERIIALVNSLPASRTKNYGANVVSNNVGGRSVQNTNPYGSNGVSGGRIYGGKNNDFYTRARAWAYPFTGNTSFGARTPAAVDMMKGMGMMMGIGGAMGVIGGSFSDAVGYQNTMETAKAILRDNYKGNNFNKDYDSMVRVVRDVAMRTKFTAPEAADAARFMAMAGLDIPMIKSAIAPIADVAAISDTDLGLVADKMTNIMTEFKVPPGEMRKLADMMTKTFTSTNTDMMMLAESLQYAGPMAFASGQSLAEVLAMIGIMGNSGIQASMAGTTMRMMLQNLYNPTEKQEKFMEKIGLKARYGNGKRRSLFDILKDITRLTGSNDSKNIVGNLLSGKDEKGGIDTFDAASKLFRVTAAAGGASLLGNIDKVGTLIQQIQGASGNSAAVSLAKQNTVAGMWAQAKSAFTEAVVKVFEDNDMQKYLKDNLGGIIEYLKQPQFINTIKDLFELVKGIGSVLAKFVGWWIKLYQTMPNLVKWVVVGQMFFTQLGYLISPVIQFIGILSSFKNALVGVAGVSGFTNLVRGGSIGAGLMTASQAGTIVGSVGSAARIRESVPMGAFYRLGIQQNRAERRWRGNLLYGLPGTNVADGRIENEYQKRAIKYRRAASANQRAINDLMSRTSAGRLTGIEFRALQEMRGRKGRMLQMATEYSLLASNIAMMRRERTAGYVKNSDLLVRAARQGKLSLGNLGRGFGASFMTAMTANSLSSVFGSMWSSIRGGLTSFSLGLARVLGFLVNPITVTVGALGALATAAGIAAYNYNKRNKEWQEGIQKSGVQFKEDIQKSWGANTSLQDVFKGIQTIHVDTANVNINEGEISKAAPKIMNDENLKSIYDALSGKISQSADPIFGKVDTIIKGVSKETFETAYNQYVAPMRGTMKNLPSHEEFISYLTSDGYKSKDETAAAAAIVRAIIGKKGTEGGTYLNAEEKILRLTSDYNNLPISDQLAQWSDYRKNLMGIAEAFNPKNHPNLVRVTSGNFQQALNTSPGQYYEYWANAYNSIMKYIDESPAMKAVQAIHTLNSGVEEKTEAWWTAIVDIIGSTSFDSEHYENIKNFTIPTRNGKIDFDALTQKISDTGEKLNDNVSTYIQWVSQIYDIIFSNEGIAMQLRGINFPTKEEILSRLFGSEALPMWLRNSMGGQSPSGIGKKSWYMVGDTSNQGGFNFIGIKGDSKNSYRSVGTGGGGKFNYMNTLSPQNSKPTAYNSASLNSGFENTYSYNAPRPTQVIVNIDKLMDAKMSIAANADERQLMAAMQDEIGRALGILSDGIVKDLQRSNYDIS